MNLVCLILLLTQEQKQLGISLCCPALIPFFGCSEPPVLQIRVKLCQQFEYEIHSFTSDIHVFEKYGTLISRYTKSFTSNFLENYGFFFPLIYGKIFSER